MIDYDAIMAGRLGAAEKAGLTELAESMETGQGVRRGSREGMSDMLPLTRRYDTRCFALEVLGDGEEEEEMEERVREQRQKRKQQQQQQQVDRHGSGEEAKMEAEMEAEAEAGSKRTRWTFPLATDAVERHNEADAVRVGLLMEDMLKGKSADQEEGCGVERVRELERESDKEKRSSTWTKPVKRVKMEKDFEAPNAPKDPTPPPAGLTVRVGGNNVTLPPNWRYKEEEVTVTNSGSLVLDKVDVFLSPEGVECFDEEMMKACESTRTSPSLDFQRSMHLLKMDVAKLAKHPRLDEVSGKALGRDSVLWHRRGMVLLWKKLGLLREAQSS